MRKNESVAFREEIYRVKQVSREQPTRRRFKCERAPPFVTPTGISRCRLVDITTPFSRSEIPLPDARRVCYSSDSYLAIAYRIGRDADR